jgi:hypothetical protein
VPPRSSYDGSRHAAGRGGLRPGWDAVRPLRVSPTTGPNVDCSAPSAGPTWLPRRRTPSRRTARLSGSPDHRLVRRRRFHHARNGRPPNRSPAWSTRCPRHLRQRDARLRQHRTARGRVHPLRDVFRQPRLRQGRRGLRSQGHSPTHRPPPERGRPTGFTPQLLATAHPSVILRLPNPASGAAVDAVGVGLWNLLATSGREWLRIV